MKTTVNSIERVFQVVTSTGNHAFCNLSDLNKVVSELDTNEGYFTIYHFWNNKREKVSKKYMKELFKGNQLKQEFHY